MLQRSTERLAWQSARRLSSFVSRCQLPLDRQLLPEKGLRYSALIAIPVSKGLQAGCGGAELGGPAARGRRLRGARAAAAGGGAHATPLTPIHTSMADQDALPVACMALQTAPGAARCRRCKRPAQCQPVAILGSRQHLSLPYKGTAADGQG